MDKNEIITLLVATSAFAVVAIRTFFDLNAASRRKRFMLTAFFLLASGIVIFGSWDSYRRGHNTTLETTRRFDELLTRINAESRRIAPADFQMRIISTESGDSLTNAHVETAPIHISGSLGSCGVAFELVDLGTNASESLDLPHVKGSRLVVRYVCRDMTFFGLEAYPYLESLNGLSLEFMIPVVRLKSPDTQSSFKVDVSVHGRLFSGTADERGAVKIKFEGL